MCNGHLADERAHNDVVKRFEIALEVGPIDEATVAGLKGAGYMVFRGESSWRVQASANVISTGAVRAQAHALAVSIIREFALTALTDPPAIAIRDPDAGLDDRPDLLLADAERASDRPPMPRAPRKLYQRVMELGLGGRKGD